MGVLFVVGSANAGGNLATTTLVSLGIASAGEINAINAQLADLNGRVSALTSESRRGIAATAALAPVTMLSAPGRTTFSLNTGCFHGKTGLGVGFAHRLMTASRSPSTAATAMAAATSMSAVSA